MYSFEVSKKRVLSFIRPMPNYIYIHNPLAVKYVIRLTIEFNHLKEHKFRHNFPDSYIVCAAAAVVLKQWYFLLCAILILKDKPSLKKIRCEHFN